MRKFKFKLIKDGLEGIEVSLKEALSSGETKILDDVTRKRRIPVNEGLVKEIQMIKYYFLNLTGHWIPPYERLFDFAEMKIRPIAGAVPTGAEETLRKLWQRTTITGAGGGEKEFYITGKIEPIEGKTIGLATPKVSITDDVPFFDECYKALMSIMNGIREYLERFQVTAAEARQALKPADIEGLSEEEIVDKYMHYLEERGLVILGDPQISNAVEQNNSKEEQEEEVEHDEGEDPDPEAEAEVDDGHPEENTSPPWSDDADQPDRSKGKDPGPPAATIGADLDKEVPEPIKEEVNEAPVEDLNALEHSENLGMEDEEDW